MGIGEYNFQNTNSMKRKETKFFKGVIQLWPENGCFSSKVKYVSWCNLWLYQNEPEKNFNWKRPKIFAIQIFSGV